MQTWMLNLINSFGYLGIVLLILIENIFPPIPSEVILTFGGFMTTYTKLELPWLILASTIGSVAGAFILYYVGRLLNKERLAAFLDGRWGRWPHFKRDDVEMAMTWFEKRGKLTVMICRCIPIVRSLISIPAGMSKMPICSFFIFTLIGTVVWNTVLTCAGAIAGASWEKILEVMDTYSAIVMVGIGVICLNLIVMLFRRIKFRGNH